MGKGWHYHPYSPHTSLHSQKKEKGLVKGSLPITVLSYSGWNYWSQSTNILINALLFSWRQEPSAPAPRYSTQRIHLSHSVKALTHAQHCVCFVQKTNKTTQKESPNPIKSWTRWSKLLPITDQVDFLICSIKGETLIFTCIFLLRLFALCFPQCLKESPLLATINKCLKTRRVIVIYYSIQAVSPVGCGYLVYNIKNKTLNQKNPIAAYISTAKINQIIQINSSDLGS